MSLFIQIMFRFYDVQEGSLEVEGMDIKSLNLPNVRAALGIVSQVRFQLLALYK